MGLISRVSSRTYRNTFYTIMSKGTSCKDALAAWEKTNEQKASESEVVKICAMLPPIEKMDASLQTLVNVTQLSISTNAIEKIACLNGLKKLKGVHVLKKLRVLYISNNAVKDWAEFGKLADCENLEELVFTGNPLEITHSEAGDWTDKAAAAIPQLKKLDGAPVIRDE